MNNKIAIFSDLHLGVHQNSNFWLEQSVEWVKWFKKELNEKDIKTIFFCGDFFHYRDEVSLVTLSTAQQILEILKDFEIHMITGNHDCYYKDTSEINSLSIFKGWKNVFVYDNYYLFENTFIDRTISFCPWGTKISDIQQSDVIFGHFELKDFLMNAHKICDDGEDPYMLSEKAPLVMSGHFHLRDEKRVGQSKIVYVGNPFQMDFGDVQQRKGYYILDLKTNNYDFVENTTTPKHVVIYLSKLIKVKNAEDVFEAGLPNNIVKLVVDKNISSDHLDLLIAKMQTYKLNDLQVDHDVNYNKIKIKDEDNVDLSGVDIVQAIEEFVSLLDINNKKEVVDYTVNLYNRSKL